MTVCTINIFPTFLNLADAGLSETVTNYLEAKPLFPVISGDDPSYDLVVTERFTGKATYACT